MNKAWIFVSFLAGSAVGSLVTWKIVKDKYEKINQEDAAAVRAFYSKNKYETSEAEGTVNTIDNTDKKRDPVEVSNYKVLVKDEGYDPEEIDEDDLNIADKPYIIAPEEFGNEDRYSVHDLTYYADKFVTDEQDEEIRNVDCLIGWENLDHIGEFMPDVIHVRNEKLKTDFEISRDLRNYKDVLKKEPYKADT